MKITVFWVSGRITTYEGNNLTTTFPARGRSAYEHGVAIGRAALIESEGLVTVTRHEPKRGLDNDRVIKSEGISAHIPYFSSEDIIEEPNPENEQ